MTSRLAGIEAKIGRAQAHLEEFKSLSRGYVESHPYTIREDEYINDEGFMERSFTVGSVETMPLSLPLVMGDCVQNLRAALDHLTWQLVLAAGNTPCDKTAFPIFDSNLTLKGNPRNITISGGIAPRALEIIKSSQPYNRANGPKDHPLSILHDLSNIDKHRTVLLVGAFYSSITWYRGIYFKGRPGEFPTPNPTTDLERAKPLRSNVQVGRYYVADSPNSLADYGMQVELAPRIQFGERERCEGQIVSDTLQQLLHAVRDVIVPSFEPFLI